MTRCRAQNEAKTAFVFSMTEPTAWLIWEISDASWSRLTKSGYLIPAAQFDSLQEVLVITTPKEEPQQDDTEKTEGAQTGS